MVKYGFSYIKNGTTKKVYGFTTKISSTYGHLCLRKNDEVLYFPLSEFVAGTPTNLCVYKNGAQRRVRTANIVVTITWSVSKLFGYYYRKPTKVTLSNGGYSGYLSVSMQATSSGDTIIKQFWSGQTEQTVSEGSATFPWSIHILASGFGSTSETIDRDDSRSTTTHVVTS